MSRFLDMLKKKLWLKISILVLIFLVLMSATTLMALRNIRQSLPNLQTLQDYSPLLVSQVYDRNGKKIGEFFRERRILVPFDKIPKNLVNSFLAAEDDQFYQHKGINYQSILRATLANLRAGKSVQGGSTITQQVAKTLLLSPEKTLMRKAREAFLAIQIEEKLKKEEILYLYLNQIYFGQGAYGVEAAAQTYFKKSIQDLKLSEMAILAGLPQAPTKYSPVHNSIRAKERQVYVLRRMAEVGFVKKEEAENAIKEPVIVHVRENYEEFAPYYLETVRQMLTAKLGEDQVLDHGLSIYTSLDLEKHKAAQDSLVEGLKSLDKRQGFRGPVKNVVDPKEVQKLLSDERKKLIAESTPERTILPNGQFAEIVVNTSGSSHNLPSYLKKGQSLEGVVMAIDDKIGIVEVHLPDTKGIVSLESMNWARKPDNQKKSEYDIIHKPSQALKIGDVVLVRIVEEKFELPISKSKSQKQLLTQTSVNPYENFLKLELDQIPIVEGALVSFDQNTQDVISLIGGYNLRETSTIEPYKPLDKRDRYLRPLFMLRHLIKAIRLRHPLWMFQLSTKKRRQPKMKRGKKKKPPKFGSHQTIQRVLTETLYSEMH